MGEFPENMRVTYTDMNSGFGPIELVEAYAGNEFRVITKLGKKHSWFQEEQAFDSGPLVDRKGHENPSNACVLSWSGDPT